MTDVIWEEPAPCGRRQWWYRVEPCLDRPGEWARVHETFTYVSASAAVRDLRRGNRLRIPDGQWEFRAGKISLDRWGVYARWLGPKSSESYGSLDASSRSCVEAPKIAEVES